MAEGIVQEEFKWNYSVYVIHDKKKVSQPAKKVCQYWLSK